MPEGIPADEDLDRLSALQTPTCARAALRSAELRTLGTSSDRQTSLAPASSAAIHKSSSGMRWVQTIGREGKSWCRLRTSVKREYSMSRITTSGWFLLTPSRSSSPDRVKSTEWK